MCISRGEVITIVGKTADLSLCLSCMAILVAFSPDIQSAIWKRWEEIAKPLPEATEGVDSNL